MIERIGGEGAAQVATIVSSIAELDLVVVDSLSALADGNHALDEDLATAVRELKRTAIGRDIAVLVSAPLPNLTSRADRRPTLDDFGALGAIKQHADVVLALFREELYEASRDITGATELLVRKNRNGPVGYIDLYFYAQWMRFEDMLDPDR
jgi:replicative DNA helicase